MAKPTYEQLEKRVQELENALDARKGAMKCLTKGETEPSFEIENLRPSHVDIDSLKLSDVIDAQEIQSMMDDFHAITNMGIGILDSSGNILVATGWQDICVQFHRKHSETLKNCLDSDLQLSKGIKPGSFRLYRCKNNMWDIATPIMVGGKRLGILYLGQFLFEDETPDLEIFRSQARKYGFDETRYLEAFERVPRWKRKTVESVMGFYTKLAHLISELSYSNIRLTKALKDRNHILNAFEERERFLNEMGRMGKIGGWEHDLITGKATWTKGIYEIFGLQGDVEPPGVDEHLEFYPLEHRKVMEKAYRQTAEGGAPFDLELEVDTADGDRLWCRIHGEAVMAGGKCIRMRGTFQDISVRKQMEQELARARRLESMGILAGGLAHDYNNLLSMILGNISMAKEVMSPARSIGAFLDDAEEATLKAKDLTHRLMTLSKGSGSYKRLRSVKDSLEVCASEISSFLNYGCKLNIDNDLWSAEHDPVQLKYAIRNVLKNAQEAMPEGGTITLKAENVIIRKGQGFPNLPVGPGPYLKISVSDRGVGIPPSNIGKVFDPYFSTKETGSQKGMGLGLAIAHAIVDKHDGHVAIHSRPKTGTRVEIFLPAHPPGDLAAVKPRFPSGKEMEPSLKRGESSTATEEGGKRILLMDDEEMLRDLARQMLKRLGYEAVVAKDGREAILAYEEAMASGNYFNAVILDLTVKGGMGGRETFKALRRLDPEVRAIVSSGYYSDPVLTSYEKHGFCDAIPKPYRKDDLERVLKRVLGA